MRRTIIFLSLGLMLLSIVVLPSYAQDEGEIPTSPIGRCVNMGNALDAPNEGDWGYRIEEEHFAVIAEAGFDTVRIPTRWSAHAQAEYPYTIDPDFLARVQEVVDQALSYDLNVILNIHHYEEIMFDPDAHTERLIFLWLQIAEAFKDYPDTLIFEILNEPNNTLNNDRWNEIQPVILASIRSIDPTRTVVVGGSDWMGLSGLLALEVPEDEHLIATVHYYEPFQFTHQGAEWVNGAGAWLGTSWGSDADIQRLNDDLDTMAQWRDEHNIPLFIGEFGAYSKADQEDRVAYTAAVTRAAEARGIGWCYWEFGSGFGVYIPSARIWREDLKNALIPPLPTEE